MSEPTTSPTEHKVNGNEAMAAQQYSAAVGHYTSGIDELLARPDSDQERVQQLHLLYSNRAQARLNLGDHQAAVDDCSAAIAANPAFLKSYVRRIRALSRLPNTSAAAKRDLAVLRHSCESNAAGSDAVNEAVLEELSDMIDENHQAQAKGGSMRKLFDAIMSKDVAAVDQLVAANPPLRDLITAPVGQGASFLAMAAQLGDANMIDCLVRHGADVRSAVDAQGSTCLSIAAQKGRVACVRHLITICGLDPNQRTSALLSALDIAAQADQADVVHALAELGARVNDATPDDMKSQAIHQAAMRGCVASIQALIQRGADPRARDGAGRSVMEYAQHFNQAKVVAFLKRHQSNASEISQ